MPGRGLADLFLGQPGKTGMPGLGHGKTRPVKLFSPLILVQGGLTPD